jgi:hypothetical protein
MSHLGIIFAVISAIVIVIIWYFAVKKRKYKLDSTTPVVSQFDGMSYRVHGNSQEAAEALAALNGRLTELMRVMRRIYPTSNRETQIITRRMLTRYDPDSLAENSPLDPNKGTSYTVDKGSTVALCIRERDPTASGNTNIHDIHDLSTLTFVAIHEMAHIGTILTGHPYEFWRTFKRLLYEAENAGIFKSINYKQHPMIYCGIDINHNPLYDDTIVMY